MFIRVQLLENKDKDLKNNSSRKKKYITYRKIMKE